MGKNHASQYANFGSLLINLRFLHFLVYATKSKRLPQPLETQNKSIILLFFAFLGVIL